MAKFKVEVTAGALRDFEATQDYIISHSGIDAAEAWLDEMLVAVDTLETFPERGTIPPELLAFGLKDFRQLLKRPYRLIYRIGSESVQLMLVVHAKRDLRSALEQRLLQS